MKKKYMIISETSAKNKRKPPLKTSWLCNFLDLCSLICYILTICGYINLNELKWKIKIQFLSHTNHISSAQ